ncbi:MAG: phosphotransferase [Verrucomicrobiales bacterium]|nr:phosphotransferase [Verrucomicrobiales bacterium]
MPPEHQALLILTCQHFPELENLECRVSAITKGGSDRHYYRMEWPASPQRPMILMVYTLARRDNPKFVPATHRLAALGVRVPEIYCFDEDRLCVWLQDLGGDDLHAHREAPWEELRSLYEKALIEVAKLHAVSERSLKTADLTELEPAFDEALYEWEQNYFLDHHLRGTLGLDPTAAELAPLERVFRDLRRQLAALPRALVHRDFQSQNIMLHQGAAWLVDYQGVRLGLPEYDLASLLFDPYMPLTRSQREELLLFYARHTGRDFVPLRQTFLLCAAQRLMQALGAYGNLSRNQGKRHFLQYTPTASERLRSICEEVPLLHPLAEVESLGNPDA